MAGVGVWMILVGQEPRAEVRIGKTSVMQSSEQTGAQTAPLPQITQVIQSEHAFVKRTVDGDTLDVIIAGTEEKVRLIGINSPESVAPRRPVECFGKEASHQMDLLATGHQVTMAGDALDANRDKYGRLLRYIYLEDGTFVNSWMVEKGFAFAYTSFPFQYSKKFVALELQARAAQLGLWNSAVCPYDSTK